MGDAVVQDTVRDSAGGKRMAGWQPHRRYDHCPWKTASAVEGCRPPGYRVRGADAFHSEMTKPRVAEDGPSRDRLPRTQTRGPKDAHALGCSCE